MAIFEGKLHATGLRVGIVAARFNGFIVESLVAGAVDTLQRSGLDADAVDVAWVPGAFEIPVAAARMAKSAHYDAVICLGAIIRGATAHFDHVASPCAAGVARAAMESGKPVIFGVLTTDTIEQAIERAGTKAGNKGAEAAVSAIEMVTLLNALPAEI
jgi:6,7-dimethyl-8-ribityllumazine synthase